jgi:molybdopterin synthase sulfur carrier subunit
VRVLYFAWVRERVGRAEEDVTPPPEVRTAGELVAWLAGRGETYAHAFERPQTIRVAIDRRHVAADAPIAGAREVALFPPMTGG